MRAATIDRVKRRVLGQAVAENLDTIRGLPPRGLRRRARLTRLWLKRAGLLLLPLSFAGSSYLISKPTADVVPRLTTPSMLLTGNPGRSPRMARASLTPTIDSLQRFDPAALPLSVHRVVLDAGHGGKDAGATTTARLTEKDITL